MGRCIVRNGEESPLAGIIFIDFLSGYLVNEYGRQALFELPAYGGANCAVRMSTLKELGGWNPDTVTEDTDLTLRVLLSGKRVRFDPTAVDFEEAVVSARRFWKQRYRWARGHQKCLRDYWRPMLSSPHLSLIEKFESAMFLFVYHIPVFCGLGVLLTVLRTFGIGGQPAVGLLPLSMLLFVGPLTELAVGLLLGRVERRTAWYLVGFLPSFALSIVTTTRAYLDGMFGRRTAGSRRPAPARPPPSPGAAGWARPPTSPWPCSAPPGDRARLGRRRSWPKVSRCAPPGSCIRSGATPAGGWRAPPGASPATGPQIDRPSDTQIRAPGHTGATRRSRDNDNDSRKAPMTAVTPPQASWARPRPLAAPAGHGRHVVAAMGRHRRDAGRRRPASSPATTS